MNVPVDTSAAVYEGEGSSKISDMRSSTSSSSAGLKEDGGAGVIVVIV